MEITVEDLLDKYKTMVKIRRFEEKVSELFAKGKIPGFLHLSIGQEAVPAGMRNVVKKGDYLISTHRAHGHMIAWGLDLSKMFAELFGKETGYNRGRGGSMHICDPNSGALFASAIVGAGTVIATGSGLSAKLRKTDQVTICFMGDGATEEGTFHEGLNLAAIWKLPVVFVVENNMYAISMCVKNAMLCEKISDRAKAYGMPGITVDGNDVLAVHKAFKDAVKRARDGGGPTLIECLTYRHHGHWEGDPDYTAEVYRKREEVQEWLKRDPIKIFEIKLKEMGVLNQQIIEKIEKEIQVEIEEAVKYAERSPLPDPEKIIEDVFSTTDGV
ncbi:MAG: pyruvate dehydrogenase (acetyl-transferring) E1 component subunit alpha [Candidatus Hadarchaeum yellowstonense]|jgi:pyruvate dehydrogenase E1 component alpha subunit|uniref:Pyruvate dehydrogenase (Acetyl-transferring) E1 component subunit alpha n=1 Tax=Hadarchaeum yellowstonense TaxID=1776334 RepID=A0A147JXK2_HADYE|nr:MAG: pyruvate dehydrogenase (acetyl-transferring) E1 component subunit alpha [Candidatus Hadarchaeum yellowstonense]